MSTSRAAPPDEADDLRRAVAAANDGRSAEAIAHLEQLLSRDPQHEIGNGMMAALYAQQGDRDVAAHWYERTLVINPDNPLARFHLGLLHLLSERPQQALDTWAPSLQQPEDYMAHFHSAVALVQLERNDEARPLLGIANQHMPQDHPLRAQLHELLQALGSVNRP